MTCKDRDEMVQKSLERSKAALSSSSSSFPSRSKTSIEEKEDDGTHKDEMILRI